jgi:hypothetical protein
MDERRRSVVAAAVTRRGRASGWAAAAWLLAWAVTSSGQTPATLKGVVFDPTNRLLPEAALVLTSVTDASVRREHTTDRTGLFEFTDLAPGRYVLEVSRVAFRTLSVEVDVAGPTERNVRMAIGTLRETITISGSADSRGQAGSPPGGGRGQSRDDEVAAKCGAGKPGRVGGVVVAPRKVWHVNPRYPESLARARLGGAVNLVGTILADGTVADLRPEGSARAELVQATAAAVAEWRFTPVLLNCDPVAAALAVEARFVP